MCMVKSLSKSIIFILLLTVMVGQINRAEARLYQSDSNPFIKMMLTMMDVMGMVDRVPNNAMYGQHGSPWSSNSNPYMRAMAMRGIYPGSGNSLYNNAYTNNLYGNNPFARSPWLQSPWLSNGQYGSTYASPLWGSPDWGVLPAQKYLPYGYPYYGQSYWSDSDLEGWVEEPWEYSEWNPGAEKSDVRVMPQARQQMQAQQQVTRPQQDQQNQQSNVPLVQNFNITVPETSQLGREPDNNQRNRQRSGRDNRPNNAQAGNVNNRSPLAKLAQPELRQSNRAHPDAKRRLSPLHKKYRQQYPAQQQMAQQPNMRQPNTQQPRRKPREKACISEFCGLKKPNLNGLWVAQNGEMLGVKGEKFLWADSSERYLAGYLKIENEYLVASVEGSERLMRFKYKLAGDHLLTMQPDGVTREFIRTSPGEIYGGYYGGY